MSPRGPSGALKSLFKNLKKPCVFTRFWVQRPPKRPSRNPRAAQETPKDLQNAMQKSATKNQKKCLLGRKCLKPAISKKTPSGTHFWSHFLLIFKLIFCLMLDHCLEPFRIPFWNPWWMKTAQREKQMTQNNHQRHQKPKKQHSQKT